MDYRDRNYYLVRIDSLSYDMRMQYFKLASPSLKIHPPYNHFKNNDSDHDAVFTHKLGCGSYLNMMLSCRKEDSEAVEYELRKSERRDGYGSRFLKLDKELCGQ